MNYRKYDPENDAEACHRIWREVGWISEGEEDGADRFWQAGPAYVADIDGSPECMVTTGRGQLRYLDEDLDFHCICGVTTSRIARRQGLASGLTANAVAEGAADGAAVAGLGMFEQGYYNRLGFGTGAYEVTATVDPSLLDIDATPRVPKRLGHGDYEAIHRARLHSRRHHGQVVLDSPSHTRGRMESSQKGFGLGYVDDDGEITHHIWCDVSSVGQGPYNIRWMTWNTPEQLLELMALISTFGDQVRVVRLQEPRHLQLQDLIKRPFTEYRVRDGGNMEIGISCRAWWQMRMLNLPQCLERTILTDGVPVEFNLKLTDPIEEYLDENSPWTGASGEYVVKMGPNSWAAGGSDESLPTMEATVNAFTRMWLGVRPASGLAVTDDIAAPRELLEGLDNLVKVPAPRPNWDF